MFPVISHYDTGPSILDDNTEFRQNSYGSLVVNLKHSLSIDVKFYQIRIVFLLAQNASSPQGAMTSYLGRINISPSVFMTRQY